MKGKRILMFVGDVYEDLELWYPKLRLIEAGFEVVVAGPKAGATYMGKHGYPCVADAAIAEVDSQGLRGRGLPGRLHARQVASRSPGAGAGAGNWPPRAG